MNNVVQTSPVISLHMKNWQKFQFMIIVRQSKLETYGVFVLLYFLNDCNRIEHLSLQRGIYAHNKNVSLGVLHTGSKIVGQHKESANKSGKGIIQVCK